MSLEKRYYHLYDKLNKEKQYLLAEKSLLKAIFLNKNSEYLFELAKVLKSQSKWWQVLENAKEAIALIKDKKVPLEWNLFYIEALEKMNHNQEVINVFKSMESADLKASELFSYGSALEKEREVQKSNEIFQMAMDKDTEYKSQVLGIGIFYEKSGNWQKALFFYKEKSEKEPYNALVHYKLGLAYNRNYEWKKAESQISYALTLDKSKNYFFNRLALTYERLHQFFEASEVYRLLIHKEKEHNPVLYYRLGYTLYKAENYKASCEAFMKMNNMEIIDDDDVYQVIENKIRGQHKAKLIALLKPFIEEINDFTSNEALLKFVKQINSIEAWELIELFYKKIIYRDSKNTIKNYVLLGVSLYKQSKYESACHYFLEQRVHQNAHAVSEKKFITDKGIVKQRTSYAEYLKKQIIWEKTIFYQMDGFENDSMAYQLFSTIVESENFKDWKHIIVVSDKTLFEKYRSLNNVIFITKNSNLYVKYLAHAEFVVSNTMLPSYFIRREDQRYIALWSPDILNMEEESVNEVSNKTRNFLQSSHILSPSSDVREKYFELYSMTHIYSAVIIDDVTAINLEATIDFIFFNKKNNELTLFTEEKKKTLLFFTPFQLNGIGSSIMNLLKNIDLDEYHVTLVLGVNDPVHKMEELDKRIKLIIRTGQMVMTLEEQWIKNQLVRYKKLNSMEMMTQYKAMYEREFVRMFGSHQFDRIVEFNGYRTFWVSLFAFAKVKQKVIYLHSDMHHEYKLRFPSLPIVFNLYKYFDKLISVSESSLTSNKEKLLKDYSLKEEQFIYINNPLDITSYEVLGNKVLKSVAYKQFIEDKRIKFISVGRLSPEKGQIKLIEAFIELCKSEKNISLYLIGYGPLENKFIKIIQEHELESSIFLLGHQTNPFPFFKHASCKLLSSDYEGQSLVLLEALCFNLPCISTNIPGPRSILKDGYGLLCGEDVLDIINAIKTFLVKDIKLKKFDAIKYNNKALEMFYTLK